MSVVLVTGGTGLLGGAVLANLVGRDCRLLALVRGDAAARLRVSLARFDVSSDRVAIIEGDLSRFEDPRLDDVTHVVHAAASTSFLNARGVWETNVDGALALAKRMSRAPRLERYIHVGTAFACGIVEAGVLCEDAYPNPDARHVVDYTRSKAEAELQLAALDLPLVVARPSVIVGHSTLGCRASASLFWFYRALDMLKRIPWPLDTREDIVPVDYASAGLVALLFRPALAHARYHISAGEGASCSWREIAAAFGGPEPYEVVTDVAADRAWAEARLGPGNVRRLLRALGLYCRFPTVIFDNRRLMAEGVPPPPRFTDYLDRCLGSDGRSVHEQMEDDA